MNTPVKNTLEGRGQKAASVAVFNPRTIFLLIMLGVFSFSAYFVLAGFSDKFKTGNNGSAHVLSKSAIGFGGLMHLLQQENENISLSRTVELRREDRKYLRIVTLPQRAHETKLRDLKLNSPTLIILPKWNTKSDPKHKGWVTKRNNPSPDVVSKSRVDAQLNVLLDGAKMYRREIANEKISIYPRTGVVSGEKDHFYSFPKLQTITGDKLLPIIISDYGPILSKLKDKDIYILSDPDFLNTHGVANPDRAEFALEVLNMLSEEQNTNGYVFDLTLHGFGSSQNFIKLALTPPFLSLSLCLLAVAFLIAWQAMVRFGAPIQTGRHIALGKLSLIYNAADFIKLAGRDYKMAPEYVKLTKRLAAESLHFPQGMSEEETTKRLDMYSRHAKTNISWSELEAKLSSATNAASLMQGAQKLYHWRGALPHRQNSGDENER